MGWAWFLLGTRGFSFFHVCVMLISSHSITKLKNSPSLHIYRTHNDFDSAVILVVCSVPVTHELSWMTFLSMSSYSSVDGAPSRHLGGHVFNSCQGLRVFLCPMLVSCWSVHFSQGHCLLYSYIFNKLHLSQKNWNGLEFHWCFYNTYKTLHGHVRGDTRVLFSFLLTLR